MPNNHSSIRLFICMKTRHDRRASCGCTGAAEILKALRLELMRRGQRAAHIDVRPCGCLEMCEDAPVILGFTGAVAEAAMPPRNFFHKLVHRPAVRFKRVSLDQIPQIVDRLLEVSK
jgi:(2Fe-2S) ferredoxin